MLYRFSNTSLRESNLELLRICCFARLMECIKSLFDIILRVSFMRFQSSRLITTDLGLPSGEVMNSTLGASMILGIVNTSLFRKGLLPCFNRFTILLASENVKDIEVSA